MKLGWIGWGTVDWKQCFPYPSTMTATLFNRGQMVIPAKARKEAGLSQGDVMSVQIEGDGRILLVRLAPPKEPRPAKARLVARKGTHPVVVGARKPSVQELKDALADFAAPPTR
jgi:AbrB family looped-hinge helix DNA binding protein